MKKIMPILLCFAGLCYAESPQPLVYLSFDQTWNNSGTTGSEAPTAVEDVNGFSPRFLPTGVKGYCLDLSHSMSADGNTYGRLMYGNPAGQSKTALQQGLSNLASFTIMGWFRFNKGGANLFGGTLLLSRAQEPNENYFAEFGIYPAGGGSKLRMLINGLNYTSGTADAAYTSYTTTGKWYFFAVTYDSTAFWMGVNWLMGKGNNVDDLFGIGSGDLNAPGEIFEGLSSELIIGSANDGYAFKGQMDEIRIFGSTTDSTGALTLDQIKEFYAQGFLPKCGDSQHPYPKGDLDLNCVVNLNDLGILCENWLENNTVQ